jgi:hypothetical protein
LFLRQAHRTGSFRRRVRDKCSRGQRDNVSLEKECLVVAGEPPLGRIALTLLRQFVSTHLRPHHHTGPREFKYLEVFDVPREKGARPPRRPGRHPRCENFGNFVTPRIRGKLARSCRHSRGGHFERTPCPHDLNAPSPTNQVNETLAPFPTFPLRNRMPLWIDPVVFGVAHALFWTAR